MNGSMKRFLFLLLAGAGLTFLPGRAAEISGRVFRDMNGNGRLDRGERVLRDVGITDGDTIVWSDRNGRYRLSTEPGRVLSPILPDGYVVTAGGLQNRGCYCVDGNAATADFGLCPVKTSSDFRLAVLGDIQVDTPEQLELARQTVIGEIAGRNDLDGVMHMGDLVNDDPSLLEAATGALGLLPQPIWTVIGNHDLDIRVRPRTGTEFRKRVGSDITAFFRGNCCFVLLNNVEAASDNLSDAQLRFLQQLVGKASKKTLFVLCQHVPMARMKNREAIFSLLGGHRVLILSAHAHTVFRREWSDRISEVSVGACCGSWWTGECDPWGIPAALQQCGTPRGYFLFDFRNGEYLFRFKGIGLDAGVQADLWVAGVDSTDRKIEPLNEEPAGRLLLNVYGGGEATSVEYSVDGIQWRAMERVERVAPAVLRVIYMNYNGGYPTGFARRTPLRRRTASPHLWEAQLPDSLLSGDRWLHFRVSDTRGLESFELRRALGSCPEWRKDVSR